MGKEMSKILPGIYLGRLDNAQNDNDMMANCITHVLSVHEPVKQKLQKFNSYKYFEVNVKDEETAIISKYFSKTNDFIHEARIKNGNVLIHCLAGVSRAPTVVLAYLMTVYDLTFQEAYNCLRGVRPNVKPIATFIKQLNEFESNEVIQERKRLIHTFGDIQTLEEDKKLIRELISQYEKREQENFNIDNSLDSSHNDQYNDPFNLSFDDIHDSSPNVISSDPSNDFLNPLTDGDLLQTNKSHLTPSPTPERQSDLEEEIDVPGSIPIGSVPRDKVSNLGTSNSDYRGRAHSRQSQANSNIDVASMFNRYGQTAPPSLPLFFNKSD